MRTNVVTVLLIVAGTLSGCAQLRVNMEVLNPAVVRGAIAGRTAQLAALREPLANASEQVTAAASQSNNPKLLEAKRLLDKSTSSLATLQSAPSARTFTAEALLRSNLNDAGKALAEAARTDPKLEQAAEQVETVNQVLSQELPFGGAHIAEDPFAYAAVTASDKDWGGGKPFNVATGFGFGGDVDVAIKMNRGGGFTVKGFTFNPSDAAATLSKVTAQAAVVAVRAMSGVGAGLVYDTDVSKPGGAAAQNLQPLETLEAKRLAAEAGEQDYLDALASLARVLAIQYFIAGDATKRDAERQAAIDRIRLALTNQTARLSPAKTSTQTTGAQ